MRVICLFNHCSNFAVHGTGKCSFHKHRSKCSIEDCNNQAVIHTKCVRHGGKRLCQEDGCHRHSRVGRFCQKHGRKTANKHNKPEFGCVTANEHDKPDYDPQNQTRQIKMALDHLLDKPKDDLIASLDGINFDVLSQASAVAHEIDMSILSLLLEPSKSLTRDVEQTSTTYSSIHVDT
ncbi:unnamed protein product [Aphanomyces euteiches]|uniref:Uncharacterized protein n=1 Tax=Aphanomyces euteiches TaxID=100861 RepID=A0A6G0XBP1_9STRA|nr:hypothetical protein Ae201684_006712 [Aphanomyces euteiches]KAH9091209.1 hypothetical protein Ae201684P_006609 [Aphanomyces euteiches]KAH9141088.1 hypothetical protein AeRB84_014718 [Aphanomyces euteiches]